MDNSDLAVSCWPRISYDLLCGRGKQVDFGNPQFGLPTHCGQYERDNFSLRFV